MVTIDDLQNIHKLYADDVKKFLICLTNNYDLAEELMQETFYQAYKSINRYNGTCKLSVWLCQIAKHLFYDYLKKKHIYTVSFEENIAFLDNIHTGATGLEEQMIQREQAIEIIKTVHKIKEPYSKVFLLRILGEMSFREIGEIYEKTDVWARVTYYRAKSMISERMKENESDL